MAMFAMINVNTGRRNPNNVKPPINFFPASSLMITQSRVPHSNPNLPKTFVNGIDKRTSGIIQQIEINIFVVLLWLYISLLGKYTDMHLRFKNKIAMIWWQHNFRSHTRVCILIPTWLLWRSICSVALFQDWRAWQTETTGRKNFLLPNPYWNK